MKIERTRSFRCHRRPPIEIRDLTKLQRRRQRERQKSTKFNEQNNNSAHASRFLYIS